MRTSASGKKFPQPAVYALDGLIPVIDPSSFVHPSAVLIGDVIIGPDCYIGPGACLRGDFGRLSIGKGSNIQDNCVIHTDPGWDTLIEENGHIGHSAVLHCCFVRRNALVGIGAVVMDRAEVGEAAIVGAKSFVKADFKVPPRSLVMGSPARVVRELSDADIQRKTQGTLEYQHLTLRCHASMEAVEALKALEADRPRLPPFQHIGKD
ncbi:MAG: transferase hexapeptide repeat family protein [Alphaproteobacteria bacterium]|nr:transferase hexapeptide repeat family protein [Alphaproteobacteria bacterium]